MTGRENSRRVRVPQAGLLLYALAVAACSSGGGDPGDDTEINVPPVADAGPAQTVAGGASVQLDGSASFDVNGDPITYQWTQVDGLGVELTDATAARPEFTAPDGYTADESLVFSLRVNDGVFDSDPHEVTITAMAAPTPQADGFLPNVAAALADGQFSTNNRWTVADLNANDVDTPVTYERTVNSNDAGIIDAYTTLRSQYDARRRQCEQDFNELYPPGEFTQPTPEKTFHFQDRKCYPTQQKANAIQERILITDEIADQALGRYGYYCGGGYPDFNVFGNTAPEPLDGVDYCCRLHDAAVWGEGFEDSDRANECGIVMCLTMVSEMPLGLLATALPDVEEARQYWYGNGIAQGASTLCPGNQFQDAPAPVFGP